MQVNADIRPPGKEFKVLPDSRVQELKRVLTYINYKTDLVTYFQSRRPQKDLYERLKNDRAARDFNQTINDFVSKQIASLKKAKESAKKEVKRGPILKHT